MAQNSKLGMLNWRKAPQGRLQVNENASLLRSQHCRCAVLSSAKPSTVRLMRQSGLEGSRREGIAFGKNCLSAEAGKYSRLGVGLCTQFRSHIGGREDDSEGGKGVVW